ncbi:hypothetical protein BV898_07988 [Hypsibius exemplaris]|uniref:G-protein coupled receptors family 1 profile domain-containing protein n=1 Tax=Hypsibius exemplaris TaxID=2072580 RepID=A0A1W0WRR8_HYPEX|nr:hypothetical protein BV898_07988 [Hypsibius exemplaris]
MNNMTNGTAEWSVLSVFQLVATLSGFVSNTLVFVAFAVNRSLWTPFNVYVINLVFANWTLIVTEFPMDVISGLYSGQWPLGEVACTYYILTSWYLQPVVFYSHQLIAINRIWAISFPLSYRRIHSTRTAVGLCGAMWCCVLVFLAPGLVRDTLYFRIPLSENHTLCDLNQDVQWSWAVAIQIMFYIWPQIFMVLALVVIFCVQKKRQQARDAWRSNFIRPARSQEVQNQGQGTNIHPGNRVSKENQGNIVLLLLTISVTICWTPNNIYYMWQFIKRHDNQNFYTATTILFAIQASLDPIIFSCSVRGLRTKVHNCCSRFSTSNQIPLCSSGTDS